MGLCKVTVTDHAVIRCVCVAGIKDMDMVGVHT